MNIRLALILLLLVTSPGMAQDLGKQVNDYVTSYTRTGDFSGCVRILRAGAVEYQSCFGKANQAFAIPNTEAAKFMIGSVSKQFTAAAILHLEEAGLLNTTDSLSRFFPNLSVKGKVTLEHLLTHTSGVVDIFNIPDFNELSCQKMSISALAERILEQDLNFEPGTRYQYSNGGYALLAEVIARVSGQTYEGYMKEALFNPMGLTETGHLQSWEVVPNLAAGYDPLGYDAVKKTDLPDPELLKGSGSLYSSLSDLTRWITSIKNRSLLTDASYDKWLRDYGNNYGLGISVYTSFGQEVFGHDGRINGYIADYLHYREDDVTIIILGNIQTGVADFFRRDIAAIVFGKPYQSRAKTIPAAQPATRDISLLLGTYSFGPGFNVYVEDIEGTLQARANEGGYSELIELEDGRFFSRTLYSYIAFEAGEDGEIAKMIWTNNDGNAFEGIRQ